MNKYQIGEWVVLNGNPPTRCEQIDGITSKMVEGKMTIRYERGDVSFAEEDVFGSFTFDELKAKRTRRTKAEMAQDSLPMECETPSPDSAA